MIKVDLIVKGQSRKYQVDKVLSKDGYHIGLKNKEIVYSYKREDVSFITYE